MMGPAKLGTIRAEMRKAFNLSEVKLLDWFDGQIENFGAKAQEGESTEIETLRLLRNALVKETKRAKPRRIATRAATARSKS